MVSCTGRGVLIRRNTAFLRLLNLAAVKFLEEMLGEDFGGIIGADYWEHIVNMLVCLMFVCSTAWLI